MAAPGGADNGYSEDIGELCPEGCYWQCEHRAISARAARAAQPPEEFWLAEHNIWPPPMRAADYDWQRWLGVRYERKRSKRRRSPR